MESYNHRLEQMVDTMMVRRGKLIAAVPYTLAALVLAGVAMFLARPVSLLPDDGGIDAKLERVIPLFEVERTSLEEEIQLLARQTGIELVVDWEGLKGADALMRRGIGFRVENAPAWQVLNRITYEHEREKLLAWWVVKDKVHIGPASAPLGAPELVLGVYEVQDLLDEAVERQLERERLNPATRPAALPAPMRAAIEAQTRAELTGLIAAELLAA